MRNPLVRYLSLIFSVLLLGMWFAVGVRAQTAHFTYAEFQVGGGFSSSSGESVAEDGNGNVFVADTGDHAVKLIPAGCFTAACVKTIGGGFYEPRGVAVNPAGTVYVTDVFSDVVKEVPAGCRTASCVKSIGGGFTSPFGVAVDGTTVFVADTGNRAVKEIPTGCLTAACVKTLGAGFVQPGGVAVDGGGNVFVTDYDKVKEILAVGKYAVVNTLGGTPGSINGFPTGAYPDGIAIDGHRNIFFTEQSAAAVYQIPEADGYTTTSLILSGLSAFGIAADASGNLVLADTVNSHVAKLEMASADYGTLAVGKTSPTIPLTFTFDSGGTIGAPVALTQGAPETDFAITGTGSCIGGHAYGAGQTCTVMAAFRPKFAGQRNGAVLLTDDAGTTIATACVHGMAMGPKVSFLPVTQTAWTTGFSEPNGVAVDGKGNVFVADSSNDAVKEITAVNGSIPATPTVRTLSTAFFYPMGVAVDSSGNVFVADTTNRAVKEILAVNGSIPATPTIKTLGNGFFWPSAVAVDATGNLFVSDKGNDKVYEVLAAGGYTTVRTLSSAFSVPEGVAVDGSGNVFVADTLNNAVKEILAVDGSVPASPTIVTLASGFKGPSGVALDGSGNVFVADTGNDAVKEIVAAGGYTDVITLAQSLTYATGIGDPHGVAVAANGNIFVAVNVLDYGNNRVVELNSADPPALSFATPTQVGTTDAKDSTQTVTVQNIGNAPLTFQPFVAANWLDAVQASSTPTECTLLSGLQLAAGAHCTLGIEFHPEQAGLVNGYVKMVDNALNAAPPSAAPTNYATHTITVQGTGVAKSESAPATIR